MCLYVTLYNISLMYTFLWYVRKGSFFDQVRVKQFVPLDYFMLTAQISVAVYILCDNIIMYGQGTHKEIVWKSHKKKKKKEFENPTKKKKKKEKEKAKKKISLEVLFFPIHVWHQNDTMCRFAFFFTSLVQSNVSVCLFEVLVTHHFMIL